MKNLKAWEIKKLLQKENITYSELLNDSIEKIKKDKTNSFVSTNFDNAEKIAKKLDEEPTKALGKFSGISVALEDSFAVKDMNFTSSSKMLENFNSPYDSQVSLKLKQENALIIGKTNLNELGFGKDSKNKSFSVTTNPDDEKFASGIRNSGAAVAVASDMATVAVASDINGEVRQAAAFLGLTAIKPTYGTVSRYGLNEVANSFEQASSIAKDVKDAYDLIYEIKGFDEKDSTSIENHEYDTAFEDLIKNADIKNLKIAYPKDLNKYCKDEKILKNFKAYKDLFIKNGAKIDEIQIKALDYVSYCNLILTFVEYSSNTLKFDGFRYGYRPSSYKDVYDMYKTGRKEAFGYDVKKKILLGTYFVSVDQLEEYYKKALKLRRLIKDEFSKIFENYDAVMTPTVPDGPILKEEELSIEREMSYSVFTAIANITGSAAITVPTKTDDEIFGLQFIADNFKDANAVKAGYFLERLENEY